MRVAVALSEELETLLNIYATAFLVEAEPHDRLRAKYVANFVLINC